MGYKATFHHNTSASEPYPIIENDGTTDDYKDAYFVGYTPDIVTGVWVGDDNNKQMHGLTGGTIPAKIWKEVMTVATAKYGAKDFDYPTIILNDKGKPLDKDTENAERETTQSADEEALLKEANELKEKALDGTKNPPQTVTTNDINNSFKKNQAPIPKTEQIPIAVPESLR